MRFLSLALAFASFSALACPNLAGNYASCRSTTGAVSSTSDIQISQRVESGVTIYTITSTDDETGERDTSEFAANGQTYTTSEPTPEGTITTQTTISCAGDVLNQVSNVSFSRQEMMALNVAITRAGNTMNQEMSGTIFGQAFQDTLICE